MKHCLLAVVLLLSCFIIGCSTTAECDCNSERVEDSSKLKELLRNLRNDSTQMKKVIRK